MVHPFYKRGVKKMHIKVKSNIVVSAILIAILTVSFLTYSSFIARAQSLLTDPNLVGYWNFDEGSGTTVFDSSSKGNNGTISGATWVDGIKGKALSFNGSNNKVTITYTNLDFEGGYKDFSTGFWAIPDRTKYGSPLSKGGWKMDGFYWCIDNNAAYTNIPMFFFLSNAGDRQYTAMARTPIDYCDGNWHHFFQTRQNQVVTLYIDGVEQQNFATYINVLAATRPIYVGYDDRNAQYYGGKVDEITLYSRALSSGEVKALYELARGSSDITPPTITLTSPSEGLKTKDNVTLSYTVADNVSASANISTSPVSGTVYSAGGSYNVTIVATDEAGNRAFKSVSFTIDKTAPAISSTDPANNAANVAVGLGSIKIFFSEPMDQNSVQNAFSVNPSVNGAFSWDGNTMIYTLSSSLSLSTTYTVAIGTGAKDLPGNPLSSAYSFPFTTSAVALDPSLVGHWSFDEGSGTTVFDSSSKGNNGTISGATWVDGIKGGKALSFNGSNNKVTIPYTNLDFEGGYKDFSTGFWAIPDPSKYGSPLSKGYWKGDGFYWCFDNNAAYTQIPMMFFLSNAGDRNYTHIARTPIDYCDGNWHQFFQTRINNVMTFYVDGVNVVSGPFSINALAATRPIYVGYDERNAQYYGGKVDEITLYSRGLFPDEVKALYEEGGVVSSDTTPPTITINSPTEGLVTTDNVTLSYTVADDVSAAGNIAASPVSGTVYNAVGSYNVIIVATDEAGNASSKSVSFTIKAPDTTPPTITINSPTEGLVTTDNVTLSYTVADDVSAAANISTSPVSGTVYSAVGSYNVIIVATDEAGNTASRSVSFTVDRTAPTITINSPTEGLVTADNVTLSYTVADDVSAIGNISTSPVSGTVYSAVGSYNVIIVATDEAGNTASNSVSFTIGNTSSGSSVTVEVSGATLTFSEIASPGNTVITSTPNAPAPLPGTLGLLGTYYDIATTATFSGAITVSFPYDDAGLTPAQEQGLKLQQYDNGNWVDITTSVDTANNIITGSAPHLSYFAITKLLDITPPATTVSLSGTKGENGWHISNVTVTFTSVDPGTSPSGVDKIYYSLGELDPNDPDFIKLLYYTYDPANPPVIQLEGVATVYYYAVDNAGNKEGEKSATIKIDKTLPMVSITATPATIWPPNKKQVAVKINGSAADAVSGMASKNFGFKDEYNEVNASVTDFGQTINVVAWRNGDDMDGRLYTVSVSAKDQAGLTDVASAEIIIPHDMRK